MKPIPTPLNVVVWLTLLLAAARLAAAAPADTAAQDRVDCIRNLKRLYAAIYQYRLDHHDLPKWLSDLVPQYIESAEALKCPITQRTGRTADASLPDSRLPGTYSYEFCDAPVGGTNAPSPLRWRDWRQRQMGLTGSGLPLVRCYLHAPVLNLSFSGKIYESGQEWEALFADVLEVSRLLPSRLFGQPADKWVLDLAAPELADPKTSAEAAWVPLDLTASHNALLTIAWLPRGPDAPARLDLADLPRRLETPNGVQFEIGGIVQLTGKQLEASGALFPETAQEIPVGLKCRRLHFLHAASGPDAEDTAIGFYRLTYVDGRTEDVPIVFGKQVREWIGPEAAPTLAPDSVVAWAAPAPDAPLKRRLFHTTWEPAQPPVEIKTIDFASNLAAAAPFLVAVTVERVGGEPSGHASK
jgi:hypothetical protein